MQGGGTGQFAAIPLNLGRGENPTFDYITSGTWSVKAAKEAEKYGKVNLVFPKPGKFTSTLYPVTGKRGFLKFPKTHTCAVLASMSWLGLT